MDNKSIMNQSIENMRLIYKDVSQVMQIIEQQMKKRTFNVLGDASAVWAVSARFDSPDGWLYRWFSRAYTKPASPNKIAGFCIHLGGYSGHDLEKLESLVLSLPLMNISIIDLNGEPTKFPRTEVYELLWGAGWFTPPREISDRRVIWTSSKYGSTEGQSATFFVDPFSLHNGNDIERLVTQPLMQMFAGKEDYVVTANLPVLEINEGVVSEGASLSAS